MTATNLGIVPSTLPRGRVAAPYSVQEWRCGLAATRLGRADGCGHWQELTGCGDLAAGRREYDAWRRLLPTTPLRLIARPSGHVIERQPGR